MDEPIDRIVPQVLASERSLTVLLVLLVLAVFVIPVLGLESDADRLYADVMLSLLLVAGVAAASPDWKTRRFMAGVTLITLVLRWGAWMPGGAPLAAALVRAEEIFGDLLTDVLPATRPRGETWVRPHPDQNTG